MKSIYMHFLLIYIVSFSFYSVTFFGAIFIRQHKIVVRELGIEAFWNQR